jgi:hypothetical protein
MRSKKHGIILLLFSGLFIMDGELSGGTFLGALGLYFLYKWWSNPRRQLEQKIDNDAKLFNIKVPRSYPLHMTLIKVYSKYLRLKAQFPALKETYTDIIETMWKHLATLNTPQEWKVAVENVDANWPIPIDMKEVMSQKMSKLQKETKQWENATLQASKIS